jgi:hypothetical protein
VRGESRFAVRKERATNFSFASFASLRPLRETVFLLLCAGIAQAQVGSSVLLGSVRDESGAVVQGVKVEATGDATGFSRTVFTAEDGSYRIEQLLPGIYTVRAGKDGFRNLAVPSVLLEIDGKGALDLTLKVGDARDSITVSASVSPVAENDASMGYRLDSSEILALPLAMRNVISLVTLGPGAIPRQLGGFTHDVINDVQAARGAVALNPPINGARSTMNSYLLDGAADTDRNTFAIAVTPPMESVQEFRIHSSLASAEFAQAGGGVVDVVTKAGGLNYHGSAFELLQNEATDARDFFDDPALPRAIFRQNQFGGSLGGPLIPKSSTFFFFAYEGLRGTSAKSTVTLVPDQAERGGDFTGGNPIFDPLSLDASGNRMPFPGNTIPANRIDPIAREYLQIYEPLPNRDNPAANYLDATPNRNTNDSGSVRIDRQFRNQSRIFGRYTVNNEDAAIAGSFPVRPTSENLRAQQATLGYTAGKATWLNAAQFAFTRLRIFDVPQSAFQTNVAQQLGIAGAPSDPFTYGLPEFEVTDFSTVTDDPTLPQLQRDNLWYLADGVSVLRGAHTLKFGFEWTHFQMNYLQSDRVRGEYTFTGAFTSDLNSPSGTGDPLADFLLGFPQDTARTSGSAMAYLRQNSYAGYFQDDWKVGGRLTLNFGMRYEYVAPYTEARGNLLNLDYSNLPAAPTLVRVASAVNPDFRNFAPRVGLALRLPHLRDTVFRAGYGIYYSPEIATASYDLVRNQVLNQSNETNGVTPILTIANGFPQTASTGFPSYYGLDPNARTPYVQQWTAGFQRALKGVLIELAYAGSKGTHLGRFRQFNTPLDVVSGADLPPRAGDLQALREFPQLGDLVQRQDIANSSYHSLQIKVEKRLSGRLGFLTSFVWSKSIDDADSIIPGFFDSAGAQDERNLRLERGLSFFNVGRRLSSGFVYSLPGAGRFLNHWQLSGIVTLQDGTPLNPFYIAADFANTGTPNRPNIVPGESIALPSSQRTAERFFNTAAFQDPAPYTFGDAGRNIIPGPGNSVFDLSIHRRFPIRETRSMEFRSEFFNAFNHPNWGAPIPYPDFGPLFGQISSTGDPRRVQFGLRLDF